MMTRADKKTWRAISLTFVAVILMMTGLATCARAEEPHDHAAMGDRGKFYSEWRRPKGNFTGIVHRGYSCCNKNDCDVVIAVDVRAGRVFAKLAREPNHWYPVDPAIVESNQGDPRESPDGLSHGCVIGGVMACFVEGGGT